MEISKDKITKYVSAFKTKKIMVIGDVMIDSYKFGDTNRISPEAPVQVVLINNEKNKLGGAANVALNINSLGAEAILCSVIGNDYNSNIFKILLKEKDLIDEGIISDNERTTTIKTRIFSRGQQLLRIDEEIENNLSNNIENKLFEKIWEIIKNKKIDLIIFEDYDKGVLSENFISKIIKLAKKNEILTTVDPKIKNFHSYKGVDLFKPNFGEFCNGMNEKKISVESNNFKAITKKFLTENLIKNLLITLSENGIYITNKNLDYKFPAVLRNIVDVSGAGDTVISIASLLLTLDIPIDEIAYIANIAGGIVCEKIGVEAITDKELLENFKDKNLNE
ncbi:MAG: PfkB family carbohydrate kinase [Bacteroidales bacterium]|jgi:rfaE bifunctional protein kinase chain/domain|nr:PfkB family carbohydrate kinase [Bacteroidales bacterium]